MNILDGLRSTAKAKRNKNIFIVIRKSKNQTKNDVYQFYSNHPELEEAGVSLKDFTDLFSALVYDGIGKKRGKTFHWYFQPHSVCDVALGESDVLIPVKTQASSEDLREQAHVFFLRPNFYLKIPYDLNMSEKAKLLEF